MRRFLPIIVVFIVVAAACGDDTVAPDAVVGSDESAATVPPTAPSTTAASESSTTTSVAPSTTTIRPPATSIAGEGDDTDFGPGPPLPTLLVAVGTQVDLVEPSVDHDVKTTPVLTAAGRVTAIRQASDGTIVTQEVADPADPFELVVARYAPRGARTVVAGATRLYDVAVVDGLESVIVRGPVTDDLGEASILVVPLDGSAPSDLGEASGPEFGVGELDVFGGVAVSSAGADLTEIVSYIELGGTEPAWSPTDDLPYGEPPLVVAAAFSFDGSHLYWAEGPDWGFIEAEGEFGPVPAIWTVRGALLATGETTLEWPVSGVVADSSELRITSIIDVDTHLIMNRSTFGPTGEVMLAPMILDFTVEEPWLWELPIEGVATLAV